MKNFIQLFYQDFLLKFAPMGHAPSSFLVSWFQYIHVTINLRITEKNL